MSKQTSKKNVLKNRRCKMATFFFTFCCKNVSTQNSQFCTFQHYYQTSQKQWHEQSKQQERARAAKLRESNWQLKQAAKQHQQWEA
jgi:hypothetical protein